MLALRGQDQKPESVYLPNILPCRIHSSGPTRVTKRYWSPVDEKDNSKTSYFRGRRLRGKILILPPGYIGITATGTKRLLPQQSQQPSKMLEVDSSAADDEDDEPADKPEPVKILQSNASFSEITVWGHDMLPAADDPFVKGIEEWIAFAEAIHLQPKRLELPTPIAGSTQVAF